jgi:hypothetical protein
MQTTTSYLLTLFILLTISACGGSGGHTGEESTPIVSEPDGYDFLVMGNYNSNEITTNYYKLTMPIDGNIDFSSRGTQVSIYDMGLNSLGIELSRESGGLVRSLQAGEYILEFDYWSNLIKQVTVFTPTIVKPDALPELTNKSYESSINIAEYYKLFLPADGQIAFSSFTGTSASIYDTNLNLIATNPSPDGNLNQYLVAGNYIIKLYFWGRRTKTVTIFSSALN